MNCPACDRDLPRIKPSIPLPHNEHKAGLWCPDCQRAWRVIRNGDGWRVCWDISIGERTYVLNGHTVED